MAHRNCMIREPFDIENWERLEYLDVWVRKPVGHLEDSHYAEPRQIICKWCGSADIIKRGIDNGVQEFTCNSCGRRFTDKDAPYGMRTTVNQIGNSLANYYKGLSLTDIAQELETTYDNPVDRSTVYRWLLKYTEDAVNLFSPMVAKVSDKWVADETAIKIDEKLYWVWDIIDSHSRFLLATHLSPNRGTKDAQILMELASKKAGGLIPKVVITDKLAGYLGGIELTFGSDTKHIQGSPFDIGNDSNLIERMQGTIKERTKILRGFKTVPTARLILDGFIVHYNYFRTHLGLKDFTPKGIDKTPAEVAKIDRPVINWTELVRKVGGIA
jgi:transposase-like protein